MTPKQILIVQDWTRAKQLIENMKGGEVILTLSHLNRTVPVGCYALLVARAQKETGHKSCIRSGPAAIVYKVLKSPQGS